MHQSLFIVDAFFQRNHGFRTTNAINVGNFKDDVLGVSRILRPNFTADVELTRSNVGNGDIRYLCQSLQNKFGLVRLF